MSGDPESSRQRTETLEAVLQRAADIWERTAKEPPEWEMIAIMRQACAEKLREEDGMKTLENRVADWVISRLGETHMQRRERAMRLLEESIELAQAEGITQDQVYRQTEHVFWRAAGEPDQEAAGVAVCLLGWCAATSNNLEHLALAEIERIEAKPIELIRGSLARKNDADLVVAVE